MTTRPVAGVCHNCGLVVDDLTPGSHVEAVVWERLDSRRGRRVVSRKTTGRVTCPACQPEADGTALTMFDT